MIEKILRVIMHPAWFMPAATVVVRQLVRIMYGLEITGTENVPKSGAAIVASNHVSLWDPPVVGFSCPRRLEFMAKKELYESPFMAAVLYGLRTFPIDRENNDVSGIREALRRLREGRVVGIFIEGTRTGGRTDVQALDGAGFLARASKAPVVPTAIWREGRKFRVHFSEPIEVGKISRKDLPEWTAALQARIYSYLPAQNPPISD